MDIQTESLTEVEAEVIDIFVRAAQVIGLPKSIGEIYGLLFIVPAPMSMDQIMGKLQISLGTASQGLKQLLAFKAVKAVYVPGQRKDFFSAESEFRKLMAGFFKEEVSPQLEVTAERLQVLKPLLENVPGDRAGHYRKRLEKIERWQQNGLNLINKVLKFINY